MTRSGEQLFRAIFDNAPLAIVLIDVSGRFVDANDAALRLFGRARERLIGMSARDLTHPEDVRGSLEKLRRLGAGEINTFHELKRCIRDDGSVVQVSVSVAALRDEVGAVEGMFAMIEDVTERAESRKLETMGRLASGLAHEINNPLQYIANNIEFVEEGLDELRATLREYRRLALAGSEAGRERARFVAAESAEALGGRLAESVRSVGIGVERVGAVIRAMLQFGLGRGGDKRSLDLNAAMESATVLSKHVWEPVARLELVLDRTLPVVPVRVSELNQTVLNLIVNAAQAIAEQGRAEPGRIEVRTVHEAPWARIEISDDGPGISDDVRARMFEPFFTTKDSVHGTGQGLALARAVVVEQHAGRLEVESRPGAGARFVVRLPLRPEEE